MAWTQTDLDAIEASIKTGQLDVRFGDRRVLYRSLDEMLKIRDLIRGSLVPANGGLGLSPRYAKHSKGLQ